MPDRKCLICNSDYSSNMYLDAEGLEVNEIICMRCGKYEYTEEVEAQLKKSISKINVRERLNVSSWLYSNQIFQINKSSINLLHSTRQPTTTEKQNRLLLVIDRKTSYIGELITFNPNDIQTQAETWSINGSEIRALIEHLRELNLLKETQYRNTSNAVSCVLSVKGFTYVDKIKTSKINSSQGFVAMWFKPEMTKIYDEAIAPAIIEAGYSPLRVDKHEHNNDITDEIIAQIRRSKFLVSDYTGHRGGVYYEAGFARGLGLEVFMTCRKDSIGELHFDVNHRICIEWTEDNLPDLKKQLANKIEATLGRGPIIHDA